MSETSDHEPELHPVRLVSSGASNLPAVHTLRRMDANSDAGARVRRHGGRRRSRGVRRMQQVFVTTLVLIVVISLLWVTSRP